MTSLTQETGWLLDLYPTPIGSALIAAVAAGGTVLPVADAVDFDTDGGVLRLNGALLDYDTADPDTDTVTLSAPLAAAADLGDKVTVWDLDNALPASELLAYVELVNATSDNDPVAAKLAHGLGAELAPGPRAGRGETVLLENNAGSWRVIDVVGKEVLIEVTYGDPDAQHLDIGRDGLRGYRVADNPATPDVVELEESLRYDVATGQLTVIGEIGTALPGEVGVFMFSTKFSFAGGQVTEPEVQLNVGATRDQPRIRANSTDQSGLYLYSGANTIQRESRLNLNNAAFTLSIENSPDGGTPGTFLWGSQTYLWGRVGNPAAGKQFLLNDDIQMVGAFNTGSDDSAPIIWSGVAGGVPFLHVGFLSDDATRFYGMRANYNDPTRIGTTGPLEVRSPDSTAWRKVQASEFEPMSDSASKTNLSAPSLVGLEVLRQAPTYEYEYRGDSDVGRRIGVMADDLPDLLTGTAIVNDTTGDTMKTIQIVGMLGVLWQAVQELDVELDTLRDHAPARAEREVTP